MKSATLVEQRCPSLLLDGFMSWEDRTKIMKRNVVYVSCFGLHISMWSGDDLGYENYNSSNLKPKNREREGKEGWPSGAGRRDWQEAETG